MEIAELVQKAQGGDSGAFGQIFDEFADRIFRFIKLKVPDQQQAEDILQEVFLKAWKNLGRLRLENLNFSAWLYKIAQNTVNDFYRQYYRTPDMIDIEELVIAGPVSVSEEYSDQENIALIKLAFEDLPLQYKQILELRFVQDLTLEEVSEILGKTNLAVRLVQYRALKKLKEVMKKKYAIQPGTI